MPDEHLSRDLLLELFEYKDGKLFWKVSRTSRVKVGDEAGNVGQNGYRRINLNYKCYYVHRLVYLIHHNDLPKVLDHIDGNPLNNRIENLRPATSSQNSCNSKIHKHNTSGVKGVSWNKLVHKGETYVCINTKKKNVGFFECLEEAKKAVQKARAELHGEYANQGEL